MMCYLGPKYWRGSHLYLQIGDQIGDLGYVQLTTVFIGQKTLLCLIFFGIIQVSNNNTISSISLEFFLLLYLVKSIAKFLIQNTKYIFVPLPSLSQSMFHLRLYFAFPKGFFASEKI